MLGECVDIAIPAYNKYQKAAKINVVKGSINQIQKAFSACLSVDTFADCAVGDINDTLKAQPGATIAANKLAANTKLVFW